MYDANVNHYFDRHVHCQQCVAYWLPVVHCVHSVCLSSLSLRILSNGIIVSHCAIFRTPRYLHYVSRGDKKTIDKNECNPSEHSWTQTTDIGHYTTTAADSVKLNNAAMKNSWCILRSTYRHQEFFIAAVIFYTLYHIRVRLRRELRRQDGGGSGSGSGSVAVVAVAVAQSLEGRGRGVR